MPILIGVAITNYVVDPSNLYSKLEDRIIEGHRRNLNVTIKTQNIDDRTYKLKLCELYRGKSFDYLILGHSRVFTISSEMFPHSSVLNLWLSGGKIEDFVAIYQICKENNIHFKNVILCADPPSLFNENYVDTRWKSIGEYYYKFLNKKKFNIDLTRFENLFSLSYFQSAITMLRNKEISMDVLYVKKHSNKDRTFRLDGSMDYELKLREESQSIIDNLARTKIHPMFDNFTSLSNERLHVFDLLIHDIKKNGANILFFCCPYHPLFYDRLNNVNYEGMMDGMQYIYNYAKINHIQMIGHFNPKEENFSNKDFYDQAHPRSESVERLIKNYLCEEEQGDVD